MATFQGQTKRSPYVGADSFERWLDNQTAAPYPITRAGWVVAASYWAHCTRAAIRYQWPDDAALYARAAFRMADAARRLRES